MNLYFDTNIYRYITELEETSQVAEILRQHNCHLCVSAGNLFETYALKSFALQAKEMSSIVKLGSFFQSPPESYLHALEVRREIKRLRPKWIEPVPRRRKERDFLKNHLELWKQAKRGQRPRPFAYEAYRRVAEQGIESVRQTQKHLRSSLLDDPTGYGLISSKGDHFPLDMENPEVFWRVNGLVAWQQAIVQKLPACRDYADWLEPYLKPNSFSDPSYRLFWMEEVSADAMPLNRLTGLMDYYQLKQKITHGNAADQIHASCWYKNDLFMTADRGLHEALASVAQHFQGHPSPAIVGRDMPSFAAQLEYILTPG